MITRAYYLSALMVGLFPVLSNAVRADECADVLTNKVYDVTDYCGESFVFMDRNSTQS
jgi:hypothetical protein